MKWILAIATLALAALALEDKSREGPETRGLLPARLLTKHAKQQALSVEMWSSNRSRPSS